MHNHGPANASQGKTGPVSPVIGKWWLEEDRDWSRPVVLQVRVSVSAEELAAALYSDEYLSPADLAADPNVWGCAAVAVLQAGLDTVEQRVAAIKTAEAEGTLNNPGWLALCRRRVAEVTTSPASQADAPLPANGAVTPAARVKASRLSGQRPAEARAPIGVPMCHQSPAAPDQREAGPVSPVIAGGDWLGDDDRTQTLTLRLRLPISAEELATALYDDHQLCPADLAKDENVWGFAAVAIVQDGLDAIQRRADEILVAEARGTLANPAWLATCRRRVAEVTGTTPPSYAAHDGAPSLVRVRTLAEIASPCPAGAQA
jgi:ribosomal protein L29